MIKDIICFIINNPNIESKSIINLLNKYNLSFILPQIVSSLEKVNNIKKYNTRLTIRSPFILDDIIKRDIENKFNKAESFFVEDKLVLAGFKAYTDKNILDLSLDSIIKKLKV